MSRESAKPILRSLRSSELSWLATLASRNYQGLVARKKYQAYSRYQYLSTSYDLGEIAYVMERLRITIWPSSSSADTNWCTPASLTQLLDTESQSLPPSFSLRGTTFKLSYYYTPLRLLSTHLLWEHQVGISWLHAEKTFSAGLWYSKSLSAGSVGLRAWI